MLGKLMSRGRRGSTLAIALVLLALTSLALVWLADMLVNHQRLNRRKMELARAYYIAEAGVAQVMHWGNYPASYTLAPTLFERVLVYDPSETGSGLVNVTADPHEIFPNLSAALSGSYLITESMLDSLNVGQFTSEAETPIGRIVEIELLPAEVGDPVSCFFKIRSVGRSTSGLERTVLVYVNASPILSINLPAALFSFNVAAAFGNARVHWGESWTLRDFSMLNRSQMTYLRSSSSDYDPWARYRSEGNIIFPSNWTWGEGRDLYNPLRTQPGAAPASGQFADAFHQRLPAGTLSRPEFDYQTFKEHALAHGRYYGTDAAGNIYRNGIKTSANRVTDFMSEFGVPDRESAPYDMIFIDTINGQPPAADGSNLATINASGTSVGLKGIFYIGANFDASGVGSPFSLTGYNPDGDASTLQKIFTDGVIYTAGTCALAGNAGVYGSVVAQRGFTGGGTPDIYFNNELKKGLILDNGNAGSVFQVMLQTNH